MVGAAAVEADVAEGLVRLRLLEQVRRAVELVKVEADSADVAEELQVRPRESVMRFPANPADMLLSGTLANGEGLANRAAIIDSPVGKGHVS